MSMRLNRIDDPRDTLSRARRRELVEFAHAQGQMDITEDMPADDYQDLSGKKLPGIRSLLRQRGLNHIPIPSRTLGKSGRHETMPLTPAKPAAVAADVSDEWAQFQKWKASQQPQPAKPARKAKYQQRLVPRPQSEINKLRDECKRLGIKMDRRDRKDDLKAKIAAHGKDTLKLLQ